MSLGKVSVKHNQFLQRTFIAPTRSLWKQFISRKYICDYTVQRKKKHKMKWTCLSEIFSKHKQPQMYIHTLIDTCRQSRFSCFSKLRTSPYRHSQPYSQTMWWKNPYCSSHVCPISCIVWPFSMWWTDRNRPRDRMRDSRGREITYMWLHGKIIIIIIIPAFRYHRTVWTMGFVFYYWSMNIEAHTQHQ